MKDIRFAKFLFFVNGAVPVTLLAWDALHHDLGANPVNFAIRTTGMLTLVFLMLTLAVTPFRKITGWNWLIFSRRTFGLYAFFYGLVHFLIFFAFDRSFSVSSTLSEMVKRTYLLVGIIGLILMVPLAITSTNAMIKRLGIARWKSLHRLVYVVAIAGVVHYIMLVKADERLPLTFATVLAVLLVLRLLIIRAKAATRPAMVGKPKFWSGQLQIVRIIQETPNVRTFRLALPDNSPLPFAHLSGQYLILNLQIGGKKVVRTYTIASSPTRSGYCEITVKREEDGLGSRHLHENLREGHLLDVSAPAGRFTFDETKAKSIVLIAGGVGITPLMSILRSLTDRNWKGDIHFIYCARSPHDIIFRQELEDLDKRFPNLHLHVTLTRAEGQHWTGLKGRVTRDLLNHAVPDLAMHPVYICGPSSMMEPTIQLLRDLGVPAEQIKSEAFVAAKKTEAALAAVDAQPAFGAEAAFSTSLPTVNSADPVLTFQRSKKSVPLPPDKTLLEIAEDAGVNVDFECRSGICGRCKTKLLAGCVTMETQDALDGEEKMQNIILMCQAKAAENVTLDA